MMGAASLMLLGATQATGTLAAFTDSATSTTGNFASAANMLPLVDGGSVGCNTVWGYKWGAENFDGSQVSFKHRGGPYNYVVILREAWGSKTARITTDFMAGSSVAAGTVLTTKVFHANDDPPGTHSDSQWTVEIHTVNMAGQVSSEWIGWNLRSNYNWGGIRNGWHIRCDYKSAGTTAVANRPPTTNYAARGVSAMDSGSEVGSTDIRGDAERAGTPLDGVWSDGRLNAPPTGTATPDATTTTPDPSTTGPGTTTETSTPPATLTPDATTTTTTPPPTTTTEPPKPALTNTQVSPSGTVTAGRAADGTAVVVDSDGVVLADGLVDPSATMQWESGKDVLWIVGPDKVNRIMKSTDGTWKFYLDTGDNMPAGIGGN